VKLRSSLAVALLGMSVASNAPVAERFRTEPLM
jgi:hypothetical protein